MREFSQAHSRCAQLTSPAKAAARGAFFTHVLAQLNLMLFPKLLVEMAHVEIEIFHSVQGEDLLD